MWSALILLHLLDTLLSLPKNLCTYLAVLLGKKKKLLERKIKDTTKETPNDLVCSLCLFSLSLSLMHTREQAANHIFGEGEGVVASVFIARFSCYPLLESRPKTKNKKIERLRILSMVCVCVLVLYKISTVSCSSI